ncbi:MAG TPA: hypothetical protein VER96_30275 [Polyangiaceae bacterium]|nr:hypothetical protein [Polyangiaceae bacterium]
MIPATGLVLALCLACEASRPRGVAGNGAPSASGTAPTATPGVEKLAAQARASDDAVGKPERWNGPFRLTTPAGHSPRPPRDAVTAIAVGAGWGCAELNANGQQQHVCWVASSVAEQDRGKRAIVAEPVPWLAVWPAITAERLCARVGTEVECWPALDFIRQRATAIPEARVWARADRATRRSAGIAAAPNFECEFGHGALECHGSDPFAVLARSPVQIDDPANDWQYPLALGLHHGCVRDDLDIKCWGRGDHGELGFVPSGRCQEGANEIACSRSLGLARVQGEALGGPPLLVAADTFTCAVTGHFVECWGKSRDDFFAAPGPARIPGLRLSINSLSAGPRGVCGDDYDNDGSRCVGAIPAPPRGVMSVAVSRGDDASACGADVEGIVCWGDAYSPRGRPGTPVRVRVERTDPAEAPVLDSPGRFGASCAINRPCARDWAKPPRCEGTPEAVPWATLARHAAAKRGEVLSVSGDLLVGSGGGTMMGCESWGSGTKGGDPRNAPVACCNQFYALIGLVSESFALRLEGQQCAGDESRLCCSAPATGQAVVATGGLDWDGERGDGGWILREPKLCSLE